ncbi:MAG: hypothetical protein V3R73_02485 [Sphingomonadales bacterium]
MRPNLRNTLTAALTLAGFVASAAAEEAAPFLPEACESELALSAAPAALVEVYR